MSKLDELMAGWNKDSRAMVAVQGLTRENLPRIPFSSPIMNYQTYGGLPRRRVVEFFGAESSGKTTTALDIVKNSQAVFEDEFNEAIESYENQLKELGEAKSNKAKRKAIEDSLAKLKARGALKCVYLDLENTLDLEWMEKLGIDVNNVWIVRPEHNSAEEILSYVIELYDTGEVGLVVLDSLPYMVSQNLLDEDLTKKAYAGISAPLTEFSRKVTPYLTKHNAIFLGINQVREDLASQYNAYTTPGGKMWKHACAVRLRFRKGDFIDENGAGLTRAAKNPYGNMVECFVEKTKAFRPDRKLVAYTLSYHDGILVENDLVDTAIEYGHINKAGAWFSYVDKETGELLTKEDGTEHKYQGKASIMNALKTDDDFFDDLYAKVYEDITRQEY